MSDAVTPEADASAEAATEAVAEAPAVDTTDAGPTEASDAVAPEADASGEAATEAVAETPAASTTSTGVAEASDAEDERANPRKVREGFVVSTSMDKTAVIESIDRVRHRRYAKTVQRSTKLFAHDETNDANVGDLVRIQETRPLSKKKRWRLVEIIERAR